MNDIMTTGIFMKNSVIAPLKVEPLKKDLEQKVAVPNQLNASASRKMQMMNEGLRMDSDSYYFTYGIDRQLHFSDYRTREYTYN